MARPQSRITEYVLDTTTTPPTATLVWSHVPAGRYAPFAGNAQRLANGNTLAGWSQSEVPSGQAPVATEITADGEEIWSMTGGGHFSYRAFKYDAPDRVAPEVTVSWPTDPPAVEQGSRLPLHFGCSDTGGSNLDVCSAGGLTSGADLPTDRTGPHQVVVRASDVAGNESTRTIDYNVTALTTAPTTAPPATSAPTPAPARADASIRKVGGGWVGRDTYSIKKQTGESADPGAARLPARRCRSRTRVLPPGGSPSPRTSDTRHLKVRWYAGRRDVTRAVMSGSYRTRRLEPGESVRLRVAVRPGRHRMPGPHVVRLSAAALRQARPDVVRARMAFR